LQQLDKVRTAVQTAGLVYGQAQAGSDIRTVRYRVCDARESLHEANSGEDRVLERNYEITGDIKGKEIIIIDDVLTTGQSVVDYKEEIERHGGKVAAAIFYGKTFSMPPMFIVRMSVWWEYLTSRIGGASSQ
jgi:adenine/guanine phosphoribosyltransferase-like PRPP-binding protein